MWIRRSNSQGRPDTGGSTPSASVVSRTTDLSIGEVRLIRILRDHPVGESKQVTKCEVLEFLSQHQEVAMG